MKIPELLAPVGSLEKLETAVLYGADAVYLGGPGLNLRARSAGLDWDELGQAVAFAHRHGVRVYFCFNAFVPQGRLSAVHAHVDHLADFDLDGLIVADPGVLSICQERLKHLPVHLSTQANTMSAASAEFWAGQGVSRVNLARELTREDMEAVAAASPHMGDKGVELEVFVHGAMCLSLSGRCLLSDWLNSRAANQGQCTQPCRFHYRPVSEGPLHMTVEEQQRKDGPLWDIVEEDGFSAMFAPQDLCLVDYLEWFARSGIHAVKIEGRMKSAGYLARVLDVYRTALDDLAAGNFGSHDYMTELLATASRPLSTGFFLGEERDVWTPETKNIAGVLARVERAEGNGRHIVQVKAAWDAGRDVELVLPGMRRDVVRAGEYTLVDHQGEETSRLNSGMAGEFHCPGRTLGNGLFLSAVK
ncbi:MAG: peptidase U32 family protein [Desulfovibrio sp.]|uniref:peptidase U32 family protein n=1 Tax=Desulfovibrio sp. 7SRBS1 TaxID=3378064 RepID=UPI003B3D3B11